MLGEALLGAAAEAIIGQSLVWSELPDRVRGWLGRDPAKLAVRKALARAYAAFTRHYPDLNSALFTEPFLAHEAAPELAKLLRRDRKPDPAQFAALWVGTERHHVRTELLVTPDGQPTALAVQASAHFLNILEGELKAEEVFRPIFDSRALETLPALEARVDALTRTLQQGLERALQIANKYEISVNTEGGAHIAGDVHAQGDFVGRDKVINYFINGASVRPQDVYGSPDTLFDNMKVDAFVGRHWLEAKLDVFLNDSTLRSGVFLLEGEAGVGKTAFLAHLVRTRGYLHVFGDLFEGDAHRLEAVRSLAAQVIARFRLEGYLHEGTISLDLAASTNFLANLLRTAAEQLAAGERIVIVADALDQAGTPPEGVNSFGLPAQLPRGVFLVASKRPVAVAFRCESDRQAHLELNAGSAENRVDVHDYLEDVARQPAVRGRLEAHGYRAEEFVRVLAERSQGNWMYLHYVIDEIQRGWRAPLNLEELPQGLTDYYCRYWLAWREGRRGEGWRQWEALYAPALAMLAAAQEPLTMDQLVAWAGLGEQRSYLERRLLRGEWRAFISVQTGDGKERYRFYHASLQRFMRGEVEPDNLDTANQEFMNDVRSNAQQAHVRITEYFRRECNGDWVLLASDGYVRRHLVTHLKRVDPEEMFRLVTGSDAWAKARERTEYGYGSYMVDLATVWSWAEGDTGWHVGRQIRCAIIESSIHSLSSSLPVELPRLAVECGLWPWVKALDAIAHISDVHRRGKALLDAASAVPADLMPDVFWLAQAISDEHVRVDTLGHLIVYLSEELIRLLLETIRTLKDDWNRIELLQKLVGHMPVELTGRALEITDAMEKEWVRTKALTLLASGLPSEFTHQAFDIAFSISDEWFRARSIGCIAKALPEDLRTQAVAVARAISDPPARVLALAPLAASASNELKDQLTREALDAAEIIPVDYYNSYPFATLVEYLAESAGKQILGMLGRAFGKVHEEMILKKLATSLPEPLTEELIKKINTIDSMSHRLGAFEVIVPYLAENRKDRILTSALELIPQLPSEQSRATSLAELAGHFAPDQRAHAINIALAISDASARADALTGLLEYCTGATQINVASEALEAIDAIEDLSQHVEAFGDLVAHMPDVLNRKALDMAISLGNKKARAQAIALLFHCLSASLKSEALIAILAIKDDESRAESLAEIARSLPDELKQEALRATHAISAGRYRAVALSGMAPYLPAESRTSVIREALHAAQTIVDEDSRIALLNAFAHLISESCKNDLLVVVSGIIAEQYRAWALSSFFPCLPCDLQSKAIEMILALKDGDERAAALSSVVAHLPEDLRTQMASRCLDAAAVMTRADEQAWTIVKLAEALPEDHKPPLMEIACAIAEEFYRALALADLAEHMPQAQNSLALSAALLLHDASNRARALTGLVAFLADEQRDIARCGALAAARAITEPEQRTHALSELITLLPDDQRANLVPEIQKAVEQISYYNSPVTRLLSLSRYVPELAAKLVCEALEMARTISSDWYRALALMNIVGFLPSEQKAQVMRETLASIRAIDLDTGNQAYRAEALAFLAERQGPEFNEEDVREATELVREMTIERCQARALSALANHLPGEFRDMVTFSALKAAWAIKNTNEKIAALEALADQLPDEEKQRVLLLAVAAPQSHAKRSHVPTSLIRAWKTSQFNCFTHDTWRQVLHICAGRPRQDLFDDLCELVPVIEHMGASESAIEMFAAIRDTAQWWP